MYVQIPVSFGSKRRQSGFKANKGLKPARGGGRLEEVVRTRRYVLIALWRT